MVASRSARERKAAADAGPLARVKIDVGGDNSFVYKVSCSVCESKPGRRWSTYRAGADNAYMAAMDRWIFHLDAKHPESEAPCMAYLSQAQARVQERRDAAGSEHR